MRVALQTSFPASKKEPLLAMFNRVHQAFLDAGLGEPELRFSFCDAPLAGGVSSVDRVLKRQPEMERFLKDDSPMTGFPPVRRLSNAVSSDAAPWSSVQSILEGIPRSFPFHSAVFHFHDPAFGDADPGIAGVTLYDNWWVNGRDRSLSAVTLVEAGERSKKLPALPASVAAVLAALGKAKRTVQMLAPAEIPPSATSEVVHAVRTIVAAYRTRLPEIVNQAALPHDLPPASEVRQASLGAVSGPMKPALLRVFKPLGYTCRGASGTFTLQRRTPSNLTAQLYLDVGTWSRQVTAIFQVLGPGVKGSLTIPVSARALEAMQYPIGDADRWQKIVENLAALVTELDRTLVPEIEQAAGPAPEWFQPAS